MTGRCPKFTKSGKSSRGLEGEQHPTTQQRLLLPHPHGLLGHRGVEILLGTGFGAAPYLFWWKAHASGPRWCLPRFCGGLYLDIKRKLPWFPSDFYEGFHIQSISAILFIYLGCITNAITFGGLLGDATDNYQVKSKEGGTLWLGDSQQGWDRLGVTLLVPSQDLMLGMEILCQVGLAALKYLRDGKIIEP